MLRSAMSRSIPCGLELSRARRIGSGQARGRISQARTIMCYAWPLRWSGSGISGRFSGRRLMRRSRTHPCAKPRRSADRLVPKNGLRIWNTRPPRSCFPESAAPSRMQLQRKHPHSAEALCLRLRCNVDDTFHSVLYDLSQQIFDGWDAADRTNAQFEPSFC